MKGSFVSFNGIGYPEDLTALKRAFGRFCENHHIEPGSSEAETIALAAMSLFQAGVSEEAELQSSLEEFRQRRIC